jgi:glutamyl-tRNA(Gln) amidotransferase subunit E
MSKLINRCDLKDLDYKAMGLLCGLEIHQQLNSGKLFCSCPCNVMPNDTFDKKIVRKLRFSTGEFGGIDAAAASEFKKGKFNEYIYNDSISCLVDLDEQPPKGPSKPALDAVIGVSKMFNLKFFDKVQFMRKLIIDGSVTTGFQRTAMVGQGGYFETTAGKVEILGINLEEDSSRAIERFDTHNVYSLDRQGIPLIEVTTGPQIYSPEQALEAATIIGDYLRSFKQTRRGLGTIRQDLNVSIVGGARVEIKGTQNLKLIPEILKDEMRRQKIHLSIIDEMNSRGVSGGLVSSSIYDVTSIFKNTESSVVKANLEIKNSAVLAVKLDKFAGVLGHETQEGHRFASEVSDRNKKHFPMIKGLFHSDELPKYGITTEEVDNVKTSLGVESNSSCLDGFILICNEKKIAEESLKNVLNIINELITSVEEEVRQVDPKGTVTKFSRPMPGASRMYPETDVQTIEFDSELTGAISIPELYSTRLERLSKTFGVETSKVVDFLDKYSENEVCELISESGKAGLALYSIIFELSKDIKKRDKIDPVDFKYSLMLDLAKSIKENDFNQNSIRDIFVSLYKDRLDEVSNLSKYLDDNKLISEPVDEGEVESKIKEIIAKANGAPFGAVMGMCMKEFAGAVDGKLISSLLKKNM